MLQDRQDIPEGNICTNGTSFRARAEAHMRRFRSKELIVDDNGIYGHFLNDRAAADGYNFLPSGREHILCAVNRRHALGKGIDLERTTGNMLSSQAMCFNLFTPLDCDRKLLSSLLTCLLGQRVIEITGSVEIEYTPRKDILADQTSMSGVDCDVLIRYRTEDLKRNLLLVETKYVEPEFSTCGFRKPAQKDKCPADTVITESFSTCRYHEKRKYHYWQRTAESTVFNMDRIRNEACPFGGNLWQLWVNLTLAGAIARDEKMDEYSYAVLAPEGNTALTNHGEVYTRFRSYLLTQDHFKVFSLEHVVSQLLQLSGAPWIDELSKRYVVK